MKLYEISHFIQTLKCHTLVLVKKKSEKAEIFCKNKVTSKCWDCLTALINYNIN